jgi:hypothetical protein
MHGRNVSLALLTAVYISRLTKHNEASHVTHDHDVAYLFEL